MPSVKVCVCNSTHDFHETIFWFNRIFSKTKLSTMHEWCYWMAQTSWNPDRKSVDLFCVVCCVNPCLGSKVSSVRLTCPVSFIVSFISKTLPPETLTDKWFAFWNSILLFVEGTQTQKRRREVRNSCFESPQLWQIVDGIISNDTGSLELWWTQVLFILQSLVSVVLCPLSHPGSDPVAQHVDCDDGKHLFWNHWKVREGICTAMGKHPCRDWERSS